MLARSGPRVRHTLALVAALVVIVGAFVWFEPEGDLVRTDDLAPAPTAEVAADEVVSGVEQGLSRALVGDAVDGAAADSDTPAPSAAEPLELVVRIEELGTAPDTFDGLFVRLLEFDRHGAIERRNRRVVRGGRAVFELAHSGTFGVNFEGDLARLGRVPLVSASSEYDASTPWLVPHIVCTEPSTEIVVAPPRLARLVVDPGPWGTDHHVTVDDIGARSSIERRDLFEPNADGLFVYEGLQPGLKLVTLMSSVESMGVFRPAPIEVELEPGAVRHVAFTRGERTFTLRGRALYEDGTVAAGVPVLAYHVRAANAARPGARTTNMNAGGCTIRARDDGTFEFTGVDATGVRVTAHPYGRLNSYPGVPMLAQSPPRVDVAFDTSTPPLLALGDFVLIRARPVEIRGSVSLAGLPTNTVDGFIASRDPATRAPNQLASGWPIDITSEGSFTCTVEGNLLGGVVWLELRDTWNARRIGPLAIVVEGQASVDLGLLTW